MKNFLLSIAPVEELILEDYLSAWHEWVLGKKQVLTPAGQVENYMYFVLEGVQKSYFLDEKKMHVMAFTYPPSFSGVPDSFFTRQPSKFFLETVTESRFLRIRYEKHQELLIKHRQLETLFRKATEFLLAGMVERHYELMAMDMETRFKNFVKRSAHLLHLVPHKDIASYLRIDPTNFSKLMGSIKI